jgi:hypothetical protein
VFSVFVVRIGEGGMGGGGTEVVVGGTAGCSEIGRREGLGLRRGGLGLRRGGLGLERKEGDLELGTGWGGGSMEDI